MICHRIFLCPQASRPRAPIASSASRPSTPAYGAGFQASDDSPHAVECELVEDGGAFVAHRPSGADRPRRIAFVDGTLRHRGAADPAPAPDGDVSMGLAGSWAAGAVLVDGDRPALTR